MLLILVFGDFYVYYKNVNDIINEFFNWIIFNIRKEYLIEESNISVYDFKIVNLEIRNLTRDDVGYY